MTWTRRTVSKSSWKVCRGSAGGKCVASTSAVVYNKCSCLVCDLQGLKERFRGLVRMSSFVMRVTALKTVTPAPPRPWRTSGHGDGWFSPDTRCKTTWSSTGAWWISSGPISSVHGRSLVTCSSGPFWTVSVSTARHRTSSSWDTGVTSCTVCWRALCRGKLLLLLLIRIYYCWFVKIYYYYLLIIVNIRVFKNVWLFIYNYYRFCLDLLFLLMDIYYCLIIITIIIIN